MIKSNRTVFERSHHFVCLVGVLTTVNSPLAQETQDQSLQRARPTRVGVIQRKAESFDGYTLFAPIASTKTYLIDSHGRPVNVWKSEFPPGLSAYLLPTGHLLRTARVRPPGERYRVGGAGGRLEKFDWSGKLVWSFNYASSTEIQHHDIEPLPNGNVLMLVWEFVSPAHAIAAGRDPRSVGSEGLWVDKIIEVEPSGESDGTVVWQWRLWDHVIQDYAVGKPNYGDVSAHPQRLDLNYLPTDTRRRENPDWTHFNSIDYSVSLDQILVSCRGTSEIYIIDHGTTTTEAQGKIGGRCGRGGDFLYRWGNPAVHRAGRKADRRLFGQHDAQWIGSGLPGAGNILVFNNGLGRFEGRYSSVEELSLDVTSKGCYPSLSSHDDEHADALWIYAGDDWDMRFYSSHISGAQRLPNGNTLICCGSQGWIFEVTPAGEPVWQYIYSERALGNGRALADIHQQNDRRVEEARPKDSGIFRAVRYPTHFAAFHGKHLGVSETRSSSSDE